MDELKACPFCGSTHHINRESTMKSKENGLRYMRCMNCSATSKHIYITNPTTSEEAWNTRPLEDALQARLEQALDEIYRLSNNEDYCKALEAKLDIAVEALKRIKEQHWTRKWTYNMNFTFNTAQEALKKLE